MWRTDGSWRPLLFYVPAGLIVLVTLVRLVLTASHVRVEHVAGPAIMTFDVAALVLALVVRRRADLDQRTRRAWTWFAVSRGLGVASGLGFTLFPWESFPARVTCCACPRGWCCW